MCDPLAYPILHLDGRAGHGHPCTNTYHPYPFAHTAYTHSH